MTSLDYKLQSGDKVEIITTKRGGPNRDWMNPTLGYTGNARTRGKIRQWFREQEREQNITQGREVVERELKRMNLLDTYQIDDIALALKFDDVDDFLCKVGFGDIQTVQITGALAVLQQQLTQDDAELLPLLKPATRVKGLTVRGVGGLHTRMAGCCNPIAPEPIIGYVTRGQGVTIHRKDCKQLQGINDPERLIEVDWGSTAETHPVPVVLTAYRRSGLIEELVNVLRGQNIGVPKTKLITQDNIMTVYLVAEVANIDQLTWLLTKLANIPNVIEARRQRWS
jgi:GTP pyrophosphokinase